jgi:hypothetical protein
MTMMNKVYYTTTTGERSGRASRVFRDQFKAVELAQVQNGKAELLGIESRYTYVDGDEADFDRKEIR